jgi:hypothetical protein
MDAGPEPRAHRRPGESFSVRPRRFVRSTEVSRARVLFPALCGDDHCACESQVGDRRKSEPRRLATGPISERPAWGWTTPAMLLTNSWFGPENGRKGLSRGVSGRRVGAPSGKRETNGETENARNHGQMGTWRRSRAVNKLRGKRCGKKNWLPKSNKGDFGAERGAASD